MDHKWTNFLNEQSADGSWSLEQPLILPREYVFYPYGDDPRKKYEWTVLALIEILTARTKVDLQQLPKVPEELDSLDDVDALRWQFSSMTLDGIRYQMGDDLADAMSKWRDRLMAFSDYYRRSVAASRAHYARLNQGAKGRESDGS